MKTFVSLLLLLGLISSGLCQSLSDPKKREVIHAAFLKDYKETIGPALEKSRPMTTLMGTPPPEGFKDWYDALYLQPFDRHTITIRNGRSLKWDISHFGKPQLVKFGASENLKDDEEYYCIYLGGAGFLVNVMSTRSLRIDLVYTEPEG